jgi:hypothetical protein
MPLSMMNGLVRTFMYMMCKFQLVLLMHMRITFVLVKLVFSSCREFCVKLKKTATETFEI